MIFYLFGVPYIHANFGRRSSVITVSVTHEDILLRFKFDIFVQFLYLLIYPWNISIDIIFPLWRNPLRFIY